MNSHVDLKETTDSFTFSSFSGIIHPVGCFGVISHSFFFFTDITDNTGLTFLRGSKQYNFLFCFFFHSSLVRKTLTPYWYRGSPIQTVNGREGGNRYFLSVHARSWNKSKTFFFIHCLLRHLKIHMYTFKNIIKHT